MKSLKQIQEIKDFILSNPEILNIEGKIEFIISERESHTIYGGLGDSDIMFEIILDSKGWIYKTYTNEYGHYANNVKFDKIIDKFEKRISDDELENYFNSDMATLGEINSFVKSAEKILATFSGNNYKNKPSLFWPK
ncbi:MAG: hypothetical protein K8R73_07495 [Clostridiales bacterium]|nr:hypothetical protein [Clostridiales bacterium]